MPKKPIIDYTSTDFDSIKEDLIDSLIILYPSSKTLFSACLYFLILKDFK